MDDHFCVYLVLSVPAVERDLFVEHQACKLLVTFEQSFVELPVFLIHTLVPVLDLGVGNHVYVLA